MGYYTNYGLDLYGEPEAIKKCEDDIRASLSGDIAVPLIDYGCVDEIKWYDWESDISAIARRNPDVLIVLSGDGEASEDIWQWRGKGDKSEYHEVEMPKFTELVLPNEE